MTIRANDLGVFPGAALVGLQPFAKADCCLYSTLRAFRQALAAEGIPSVTRMGMVFIDADQGMLNALCLIGVPAIVSMTPPAVDWGQQCAASGSNFGFTPGVMYLANAATWAGSTIKVVQVQQIWTPSSVTFFATQGGLPPAPTTVYSYVENDCGQRNAVGKLLGIGAP